MSHTRRRQYFDVLNEGGRQEPAHAPLKELRDEPGRRSFMNDCGIMRILRVFVAMSYVILINVSWNKSSLDVLIRAYLVFRPERADFSDESSSSMISEARAGPRFGNTHACSSLVEEANSLLSFSMKVEAIAIDTISIGAPQK